MDRFDPFVKYADVYGDIINWEKDPMNKPQNQNKYFFSDGKTYYEQICKMLRLMSVFKEAFNQIYSNEDEISEAWENFVNNLSASVVEGSEPDVTLTWTDDSVNFEFTMVPGVPGEQGVGITSISFNSDYTMTITLSDGNTYTSMSLKGETGPQGPQGETGSGLQILDVYATLADLQSAHPTGQPGDAYQVGSAGNYILYIWSSSQSAWVQAGTLGTVSPYTSAPLMDGTASAGSQNLYARGDHVHPSDTSRASKEELDALIRTSQALIDQSFTYRESPAIQNCLTMFDKIKGNTLLWNQTVQVSNIVATKTVNDVTFTNNEDGTVMISGTASSLIVTPIATGVTLEQNHVYYLGKGSTWSFMNGYGADGYGIIKHNRANASTIYAYIQANNTVNEKVNVQCIDLTKLFGETKANEILAMGADNGINYFRSLFPLPHYDYNAGSLLSFNGTGLKITGFNQFDNVWEAGMFDNQGQPVYGNGRSRSVNFTQVLPNTEYCFTSNRDYIYAYWYDANKNFISRNTLYANYTYKTAVSPSNAYYVKIFIWTSVENAKANINISSSRNGEYEPYIGSIANLPISQYFPTGMKTAGSVYDELTPSKAITRVGGVLTLDGTNAWNRTYNRTNGDLVVYLNGNWPSYPNTNVADITASVPVLSANGQWSGTTTCIAINANGELCAVIAGKTTVSEVNDYLQSNPIYLTYALATPAETAVDLDLDFMAYEDGTEQLLPANGSVPSTSPIIADMTYLSIDDAMAYILEKLESIPEQTEQRLEALEDDVADLQTDVGALQPAVSGLQTSVGNINTNIGQLSSTVAGHTSSISDMQSDITDLNTGLSDLEDTVTNNTSRIGTLETGLSNTDGQVQNLATSVSGLDSTVTAQGTTVTALDSIIQDISNNPVSGSLGQHELGFVAAYVDATLPANTGTMVTIPKPTIFPNNYTPLFIVGMTTGSSNVSICSIPYSFGNADSVTCRVWNHGSQQTTQIIVYILCMRQRQSQ